MSPLSLLGALSGLIFAAAPAATTTPATAPCLKAASAEVAAYTQAWNRQDRGAWSIRLSDDGRYDDVLGRFAHAAGAPAPTEERLATRVVAVRALNPETAMVDVDYTLRGAGDGRLTHLVARRADGSWSIVETRTR
jgi:hypothetical protein